MLTIIASAIPIITTTLTASLAVFGFPAPNSFETRVLRKQTNIMTWGRSKTQDLAISHDIIVRIMSHMYGPNQTLQKLQLHME